MIFNSCFQKKYFKIHAGFFSQIILLIFALYLGGACNLRPVFAQEEKDSLDVYRKKMDESITNIREMIEQLQKEEAAAASKPRLSREKETKQTFDRRILELEKEVQKLQEKDFLKSKNIKKYQKKIDSLKALIEKEKSKKKDDLLPGRMLELEKEVQKLQEKDFLKSENIKKYQKKIDNLNALIEKLKENEKKRSEKKADLPLEKEKTVSPAIPSVPQPDIYQKVTLNYSGAPLPQVIRSLSDDTNINIVAGENIRGTITVHLADVPLKTALRSILIANGYTFVQEENILRVIPSRAEDTMALPTAGMETKVFRLKYIKASDIESAIQPIISQHGFLRTFGGTYQRSVSGQTRIDQATAEKRPTILVIRDHPESLEVISQIIDEFDKEPYQISIEAQIVEIILEDEFKHGIDWRMQASIMGSSVPSTLPFEGRQGIGSGNFIPKPSPDDGSFAPGSLFPYSDASDFTFGRLSFEKFQATINYLISDDKVNLISAPHISTLDGESAAITVGSNIPIPLYERNPETGNLEISGYQMEQTGIILRVTPNIVGDEKIMLNLHPEVSEITSFTGPNDERPVTSTREANTTITLRDGDTAIIGGLMKTVSREKENKVPIMGNIPFLGSLFRYKEGTSDKTELVIFVTPHIVRKNDFSQAGFLRKFERTINQKTTESGSE